MTRGLYPSTFGSRGLSETTPKTAQGVGFCIGRPWTTAGRTVKDGYVTECGFLACIQRRSLNAALLHISNQSRPTIGVLGYRMVITVAVVHCPLGSAITVFKRRTWA
jgi:hypothetical protein